MNNLINEKMVYSKPKKSSFFRLAVGIVLVGLTLTAQAGKITSIPSETAPTGLPTPTGVQDGFGGLDFTNIVVVLDNSPTSTFNELTGEYSFSVTSDLSYEARVYDDDVETTLMGYALAKDWPVGEPAGIKIVNDDFDVKEGRPTNCIMSTSYLEDHFLDTAEPEPVLCSGPFQSHKRYKLAMLPASIDGIGQEGIDLVFNVEQDGTARDYQVFQKINNWTDKRLQGFTIQVGTGQGAGFVPAADSVTGVGVDNLSLSVPNDVWDANQLATFSSGLFGPIDPKHGRPAGYFDPNIRAGYVINEYGVGTIGDSSGQTDTLTSGATLGSDYADVPAGALAAAGQFGNWLPDSMLPYGIFYDDDADPDTDAELVAWYGHSPAIDDLAWMQGAADSFALVADDTITKVWRADPLYSMGLIDDLVNVGLNYVVTVADISGFPGYDADPLLNAATFTIRITPAAETVATANPTYVGVTPSPTLSGAYTDSKAIITLDPNPEFVIGTVLTVSVADGDLNLDIGVIDTTTVDLTSNDGSVAVDTITLQELGSDSGVFTADLPSAFSNAAPGTVVTATYNDLVGGATEPELKTASSTAISPGTLQFDPVGYSVEENEGSVDILVTRTDGTTGVVAVEYQTVSGTAIGGEDYITDAGNVTFADGDDAIKFITVTIINDAAAEPSKEFGLLLSNAQGGATLGTAATATVTLTDADIDPPGSMQFNPVDYSVARNVATIELTVERTDGIAGEATVDFLTLAGTAIAGEDYVAQTGTVTFASGSSTSQPITVEILNDETADGDETFTVQLSNAQVADMGAADSSTVTISDTLVYAGTKNDGLFSFSWITVALIAIGLIGRMRRKTV